MPCQNVLEMKPLIQLLIEIHKIYLVHKSDQCPWSIWRETWVCSKTCGRGTRRIVRHNCKETQQKDQSCNFKPCPSGNIMLRYKYIIKIRYDNINKNIFLQWLIISINLKSLALSRLANITNSLERLSISIVLQKNALRKWENPSLQQTEWPGIKTLISVGQNLE